MNNKLSFSYPNNVKLNILSYVNTKFINKFNIVTLHISFTFYIIKPIEEWIYFQFYINIYLIEKMTSESMVTAL